MAEAAPPPAGGGEREGGGGQDLVDPRFEFDAPRFYDFAAGSPPGSEEAAGTPPDAWFHTSATKGEGAV